ncbi:Pno1p [Sporobolomyces salmoneus]|uniref:Pno1p n=1 Tax=Sporobolomyces salmoneus TaxID=183962 RepID=UPI0031781644
MSSDGFLPASATSSKARKAALKSGSAPAPATSKKSSKGKGKAKQSSTSHLLSTQPNQAQIDGDDVMTEFSERVALDDGVERKKVQIASMDQDGEGDAMEEEEEDDAIMIDPSQLPTPVTRTPISQLEQQESTATNPNSLSFAPVSHHSNAGLTQRRKVGIPPHRMTPLKRDWIKIYTPLVEECGLQVRMNAGKRQIEMKTSKHTPGPSALTRAVDFLSAYALGFAVDDAIAMLRLEELYIETFEVKDVKTLHGDHLSRAIGRIAGHEGKTRFVIENASRTRIVLADSKIHILGTFSNIKVARDAISALILGSPPGKVYANLRTYASRQRSRF